MDVKARKQELEDLREIARLESEIRELESKHVDSYQAYEPGMWEAVQSSGRNRIARELGVIYSIFLVWWLAFKLGVLLLLLFGAVVLVNALLSQLGLALFDPQVLQDWFRRESGYR